MVEFDDGSGPALFIVGEFTSVGGIGAGRIAKWDGIKWSSTGSINNVVNAIVVHDDGNGPAIYVGGKFTNAGGVSTSGIAKWDGTSWSSLGPSSEIDCLESFDDGTGPALYVGGDFRSINGGIPAKRIAKWDGTSWSAVGNGFNDGRVYSIEVHDDGTGPALYAGGTFWVAGTANAFGVAKWNGTDWTSLAGGMSDGSTSFIITALLSYDGELNPGLIAAGRFSSAGGDSATSIASWDGTNWNPLGDGIWHQGSPGTVYALTSHSPDLSSPSLYIAGYFDNAGQVPAMNVAKWNGVSWEALSSGVAELALSIGSYNVDSDASPELIVGSSMDSEFRNILVWDNESWNRVGTGLDSTVFALHVFDDGTGFGEALYAGGYFKAIGNLATKGVARWNGLEWSTVGDGLARLNDNQDVSAFAVFDDGSGPALYAGGTFDFSGQVPLSNIAKWDGTSWSDVGGGVNAPVLAMIVHDDGTGPALYVGGVFTDAGGMPVNYIAKWDGSSWSALGQGVHSPGPSAVHALGQYDDGTGMKLYVGGSFISAGSVNARHVAMWDGQNWHSLGTGVFIAASILTVNAFEVFDDGNNPNGPSLFAAGNFTTAGGVYSPCVARWDGTEWHAVGAGVGYRVQKLLAFDDGIGNGPSLFIAGNLTESGTNPIRRIARWDGAEWVSLSETMDGYVYDLAPYDDGSGFGPLLFAGGSFVSSDAGDSYLARWKGCPTPTCIADTNGDGMLSPADFSAWVAAFNAMASACDQNGDGSCSPADFSAWVANYNAGCG